MTDSAHAPGHGGGHGHGHAHGPSGATARRALWIALALNAGYLLVEVVGGVAFGSLALLADAAHMASDVVGLVIALAAQRLTFRPATGRYTFGFKRAEALGAQANGVVLLAVSVWVMYEAVLRLQSPEPVEGVGLLVVATIGLGVNVASAVILGRAQGGKSEGSRRNLNLHGAFLHMAADAASSVGVVLAAIAVILWGADWVDPAVSILISLLVLWSVWALLRDTTNVLLEGTPPGLDPQAVTDAIDADVDVQVVHHLHLWQLASDSTALSAHVVVENQTSLHDAQVVGDRLKALLAERFGIDHATLELECHPCEEPVPHQGAADHHH